MRAYLLHEDMNGEMEEGGEKGGAGTPSENVLFSSFYSGQEICRVTHLGSMALRKVAGRGRTSGHVWKAYVAG